MFGGDEAGTAAQLDGQADLEYANTDQRSDRQAARANNRRTNETQSRVTGAVRRNQATHGSGLSVFLDSPTKVNHDVGL